MFPTFVAMHRHVRTTSVNNPRQLAWLSASLLPIALGPVWLALSSAFIPGRPVATMTGLILVALVVSSSYTDLRWTRIANWSTYTAFGWALIINVFADTALHFAAEPETVVTLFGSIGWKESLAGAGACFTAMYIVYSLFGTGAGDVKLATAIGSLVGVESGIKVIVICHMLSAATVLAMMIWTVGPWRILTALMRQIGSVVLPIWVMPPSAEQQLVLKHPVPMAAFFAAASLLVYERLIP